jgi:CspA family cold shock protein
MGVKGRALTFVGPEDERAWAKLRREGAPALPQIDLAQLLTEGDWRNVAASVVQPVGTGRRVSKGPRRRKPRSRSAVAAMPKGTIRKVVADRGFGFITADDGKEYFFHQSAVDASLKFDRLRGGEAVSFDIEHSQKGPRANRVRAA